MIQELLGGGAAGFLNQDRNNLPISKIFEPSPSPSPSSSTIITTTINATTKDTTTGANATNSDTQKLRCPRCDSSNTKFCYYNNYNLTQPRHFCKTCRRYWTKGGALRNVPIGGGCRKNKAGTIIGATATGRLKAAVSCELGKFNGNMEHEYSHNPILWSNPPQTSHLLSLLRATQTPNPNFPLNPQTNVKDFMVGSNMGNLGFEPLGQTQTSSLGLCSSLWRNNQVNQHHDQGMLMTTDNNERLRSSHSGNYYHHDDQTTTPLILGSSVANTSSTSTILDSAPVLPSGELGFWNQTLRWSDLAAANGAYP